MAIRNIVMVMTSDYLLLHGGATNGWRAMRGTTLLSLPCLMQNGSGIGTCIWDIVKGIIYTRALYKRV